VIVLKQQVDYVTSGHTVVNKSARPVNWVGSARQLCGGLRGLAAAAQHIGTINNWYEETHIVVMGSSPSCLLYYFYHTVQQGR